MNIQILLVALCVAVAFIFMGKKFYISIRNRGNCACQCEKTCAHRTPACHSGGACPEQTRLRELRPR